MDFVSQLQSMLGGGGAASDPGAGGLTNFGAAPTAQGIGGQILARLNPGGAPYSPANPRGVTPPAVGGNMATAMSGLAAVDPTASKFGAFAQGLAGGMAARQNAQVANAQFGLERQKYGLEALKQQLAIQQQQQILDARRAGVTALQGLGGGGAGIGAAPLSTPGSATSPMPLPTGGSSGSMPGPAPSPMPIVGQGGGAQPGPAPQQGGAPAPAIGADPSAPAPAPRMIPHGLAKTSDFWSNVKPDSNPAYIDDQAQRFEQAAVASAGDPATATHYGTLANQFRQRAAQIRTGGMVTLNDGSSALIPGFATSKATAAAIEEAAKKSVDDQHEMVEAQPVPGGPTVRMTKAQALAAAGAGGATPPAPLPSDPSTGGAVPAPDGSPAPGVAGGINPASIAKQPAYMGKAQEEMVKNEATMAQQFQQRQVSRERMQAMADILQNYQTGAYAENKANFVAKLRGVGINVPNTATANPAKFEEFMKMASMNVLSDLKDQGGGQPLVSEMESLKKANANPELQPEAAAAILGHGIAISNYKDAHYGAYNDWKKLNPYATNVSDFEIGFAKDHPLADYTAAQMKRMAYQGQTIPPADQRVVGQHYMTPKGPLVWQGEGWTRPQAQ